MKKKNLLCSLRAFFSYYAGFEEEKFLHPVDVSQCKKFLKCLEKVKSLEPNPEAFIQIENYLIRLDAITGVAFRRCGDMVINTKAYNYDVSDAHLPRLKKALGLKEEDNEPKKNSDN